MTYFFTKLSQKDYLFLTMIFMHSFQPMNAVLTCSTVYCGGGRGGWSDLHGGGQTAAWCP